MTIFVANPLVIIFLKYLIPLDALSCKSAPLQLLVLLFTSVLILGVCLLIERIIARVGLKGILN
jgi:hypothetical protein